MFLLYEDTLSDHFALTSIYSVSQIFLSNWIVLHIFALGSQIFMWKQSQSKVIWHNFWWFWKKSLNNSVSQKFCEPEYNEEIKVKWFDIIFLFLCESKITLRWFDRILLFCEKSLNTSVTHKFCEPELNEEIKERSDLTEFFWFHIMFQFSIHHSLQSDLTWFFYFHSRTCDFTQFFRQTTHTTSHDKIQKKLKWTRDFNVKCVKKHSRKSMNWQNTRSFT